VARVVGRGPGRRPPRATPPLALRSAPPSARPAPTAAADGVAHYVLERALEQFVGAHHDRRVESRKARDDRSGVRRSRATTRAAGQVGIGGWSLSK
jgi:hypothetical protein